MRGAWAGTLTAVAALLGPVAAAPMPAPAPASASAPAPASAFAPVPTSASTSASAPVPAPPEWTAEAAAGRPYVYLEGAAGSVLQDTLSVSNPGARPLTVRLGGQGAPLAFAARTVTVPARTRADVPFAVTVTAETAPGDHRGSVTAAAGGREVRVPVHLRVSGPSLAALTVEGVRIDGSGAVRYTLVNRGSTALAPSVSVRADGAFGTVLDRPLRPLGLTLRPGERLTRTEAWPDPPALDSVTIRVRASASGAPAADAHAGRVFVSGGALATGAGVLIAAAAAAAAYAARRRTRARTAPEPDPPGSPERPVEEVQLADVTAGADR